MAPVACRITDGKKDGRVLLGGLFKCLLTPWIPVHRVICVLEKIGVFFAYEFVWRPFILF
jgi:hypothetical protein